MRFGVVSTSLLVINTALLACAVFLCVMRATGLPWYGLTELVSNVGAPGWTYLLGSLIFFESMLLWALFGVKATYMLGAASCIVVTTVGAVPGPVDEVAHLAFIQHVVQHGGIPKLREKIPLHLSAVGWAAYPNLELSSLARGECPSESSKGDSYEAFQPPLYYLVMAPWYPLLPANLVWKIRGVRLLGGVLLLVAVFFVQRTLALFSQPANKDGTPDMRSLLVFGVICLTCLNPGIVYRMTILGNVQVGLVLAAMIGYWLCRMMTRRTERLHEFAILGILSGLLALSYYYSIVVLGVIAIWMLLSRRFIGFLVYGGIILLLISPWLIHNYSTYGTINAAGVAKQRAFEVGLGIGRYGMAESWAMLKINLARLFLPQESYIYTPNMLQGVEKLAFYFAWGSLLSVVICVASTVVGRRGASPRQVGQLDFLLIAAAVVAGTIASLLLVAYYSQLGLVMRYGYLMLPSLAVVIFVVLSKTPRAVQMVLASIMVFFVSLSSVDALGIDMRNSDFIERLFQQSYRVYWLGIAPDERPNLVDLRGSKFTQSFRADYDRLRGVSLFLCPGSAKPGQHYLLRLGDNSGKMLREVIFRISDNEDCSYHDIVFDPISHARGRTFRFSVIPRDPANDGSALLPLSKPGAYAYGSAHLEGKPIREDAVFDTIFSWDIWSTAVPRRDREGPSWPPRLSENYPTGKLGLKAFGNDNVGPIFAKTFRQWFVADSDDLCGIRFLVNTYLRRSVSPYVLRLFDAEGGAIREVEIDDSKMGDWRSVEVLFKPVPDSAEKRFSFTVLPKESIVKRPITIPLAAPGSYPEGHVEIDGVRRDRNVVFAPVFERRPHEKFQSAMKARRR